MCYRRVQACHCRGEAGGPHWSAVGENLSGVVVSQFCFHSGEQKARLILAHIIITVVLSKITKFRNIRVK